MTQADLQKVQTQWANRVNAEYCSASITTELMHWLIQLGASPDTLLRCHRVIADELMHTEVSQNVFVAAGGKNIVAVQPAQLIISHAHGESLRYRALEIAADFYCCGETVARPLFEAMAVKTTQPDAKKALARIAKDEARHGDFGWDLLEELLEGASADERAKIKVRSEFFVERIIAAYNTQFEVNDAERAWGLMSGAEHHQIAQMSAQEILRPRFSKVFR